jgi:hypothetical protein
MYGGGIYFAKSSIQANRKTQIVANVEIGIQRTYAYYNLYSLKKKGFDSVSAAHSDNLEFVVYNWSQVKIREINIGSKCIYKSKYKPVPTSIQSEKLQVCSDDTCINYRTVHFNPHQHICLHKDCISLVNSTQTRIN